VVEDASLDGAAKAEKLKPIQAEIIKQLQEANRCKKPEK
jgi:hypothetical protein